jgi:hypothetical protein
MPWSQLDTITPDLILSASENIELPAGDCPVLVLPHGVGFQKLVPDSRTAQTRLSGAVPDALLDAGRTWIAVSHPEQERQLLAAHPKVRGRTLLVGDPCFDELSASLPNAVSYKRALGVPDDKRLIVLSSTWGPTSLLGQDPGLPARALAELPYDEYRFAAIIHPNVWSAHGSWQIRAVLADALEAGLLLIPTVHAWRSALVAAQAVIGDHGSVTLYGAALGKPVLLATFGDDSVPGTAMATLGQTAPRLRPHKDLRVQIESVVADHTPGLYSEVSQLAFAAPGRALARLRTVLYSLMELAEPTPTAPPVLALPRPSTPEGTAVTSWTVESAARPDGAGQWVVTVRRHPAAVSRTRDEGTAMFRHLACDEEEWDRQLAESASVVLRRHHTPNAVSALSWIQDTLSRFPGCRLAAAALGRNICLVGLRDGRIVETTVTGPTVDPGLPAAVVYTCLREGLPLDDALVTLRVGDARKEDVGLRLRRFLPATSGC